MYAEAPKEANHWDTENFQVRYQITEYTVVP
jgi:hypothetical protein